MNSRSAAKRAEAEQQDDAGPAAGKRDGEQHRHDPPRPDAVVQVLDRLVAAVGRQPPLQHVADDRCRDEDGEDADKEVEKIGMDAHVALPLWAGPERQERATGAGEEAPFVSSSMSWSTGPKVHAAHQRHRDELALGHHPAEVLRSTPAPARAGAARRARIEPGLEGLQRLVGLVARALRKQDERGAAVDRLLHDLQGIAGARLPCCGRSARR